MTDPAVPTKEQLAARDELAKVEKNEADARKAKADADAARATARKGDADARKSEAEATDLESADGILARAAKNRQDAAEADQKAAAAQQLQIGAMIPDLSKAKESSLTLDAQGPAIGGASLTFGGLADAADAIADSIVPPANGIWRILITSDPDLASADAIHLDVTTGLTALEAAANKLLDQTKPKKQAPPGGAERRFLAAGLSAAAGFAAGPAAAAVAAAIPGVLSLLSAQRSLVTKLVTVSDIAAAAAVAGAIVSKHAGQMGVVHDDFRLLAEGDVQRAAVRVGQSRIELVGRKLELAESKGTIEANLEVAKAEQKDAEKAADDAAPNPSAPLNAHRKTARTRAAGLREDVATAAARLALIESLIATIDAFTAAIRVVPPGGRRTPLATAALYQAIHDKSNNGFTHVLLVKAQPAQSAQLTSDKPLMFPDKFSTIVEVDVTYILIGTADSRVVKAGTATAMAMAHGELGDDIKFNVRHPVVGVGVPPTSPNERGNTWQSLQLVGDRTTGDDD